MFRGKRRKDQNSKKNPRLIKTQKTRGKIFQKTNIPLILFVTAILIIGLLVLFSASAVLANENYQDPFYIIKKQIVNIILGIILAFLAFSLSVKNLKKLSIGLIIVGIILMTYLIPKIIFHIPVPGVIELEGAIRWIRLPGLFDLQPSEFIKISLVLFIAFWFTLSSRLKKRIEEYIDSSKDYEIIYVILNAIYVLFPIIVVIIIGLLILAEKDLSTAVVVILTFIAMYYVNGTKIQQTYITLILLVASIVVGIGAISFAGYRQERFNSYVEILTRGEPINKQGGSFQIWNGIVAMGSGGLVGQGYGNSKQKLFFLQQAAYTDSIFSVYAEEFGLIGSTFMIIAFVYFLSLGLQIARKSNNRFLSLVAIGITALISIQAFFNIAANLALIPFGGIPLPFFSYGGSNTIIILFSIGILLNISKESNQITNQNITGKRNFKTTSNYKLT